MNAPTPPPPTVVRRDRAVGAVLASACGDALGAPHEFGPALPAQSELRMTGGGPFDWAPGEWTDDTQTALAILEPLARGAHGSHLVAAIEQNLLTWMASGPADVGLQTRAVLSAAIRHERSLHEVTAAYQERNPDSAGNGSLMRTGPVALAPLDRDALADLAATVSSLTHAHDDAVEACLLWTTAIRAAVDSPVAPGGGIDWIALVADGLDLVDDDRRDLWEERLEASRTTPPEEFTPNGWVVSALQAALSSLVHTEIPTDQPCRHLRLATERAVRIGNDTDTVAAITGALAGAWWGATAVPFDWRRDVNGRTGDQQVGLWAADLDRLARLAVAGGESDKDGWPAGDSMLPHYRSDWPAPPLAAALDDWVSIGNVHALPDQLHRVDVVVSCCRMGRADVPAGVEHHVIGLLDSVAVDNPNLAFVLADAADLLARCASEGRRVFLHCVQAENRTPAVAAAYLVRHIGFRPDSALDRVAELLGSHPKPFLVEGVRSLVP